MVHGQWGIPKVACSRREEPFSARGRALAPQMVGGVREATNGTAPSRPVVLSALVVEIVARGGGSGLSQAMKTRSGVPGRPQAPHLGSPRTQETVLGPEWSSLGTRPHKHSPQCPEKEEVQILDWS